jgi:ABC-2 type transport system ATP-binding protein
MDALSSSSAIVATVGLTKHYRRVAALDDCSLSIARGEVFGLLGPNGSGKTTLLRLLMGFLRPTKGLAAIGGRDCWRESAAVHEGASYLPGDVRLFRGMRARDVLQFFARLRGDMDAARSARLAARLGLELAPKVAQMSTGMRQKLALAAVLAVDVPLLILDEPTSNLDPNIRQLVLSLIREARAEGRTVVFSSHVLSEVEHVCDRVVILRQGRVVHDQAMSQISRRHRIRARLTGPMPQVPEALRGQLEVASANDGSVIIDAPGDLASLLGWLATLPLAEVRIELVGLEAVYEKHHPAEVAARVEGAA